MRYLVFVLGLMVSLAACADDHKKPAATGKFIEGKHYTVLSTPVPTITGDKIEVTEIFRYGCGACYHFERPLSEWKKTLADDVELVKNPVVWNKDTEIRARIYFTAKALGVGGEASAKIFEAIHAGKGKKALLKEGDIATMFETLGVDKAKFEKMYNNFMVTSKVNQADARARSFAVAGTPEIFVNGKYRVTVNSAGSQKGMLDVADYLIAKIRAEG